jgi:putative transcriptional regulator
MSALRLSRLGLVFVALLLQTVLLRAALPGVDDAPAAPTLAGQLLVAAPGMDDPRFAGTVILIVQHGPGGAFGIVVNRPVGDEPLADVLKSLGEDDSGAAGSLRIFSGGPVQPEVGVVVHGADYRRPETVVVTDRLSVTSSLGILHDIGSGKGPAKSLVAFGYAGWGPGQLEHEMDLGAWATAEADPVLVFDADRDRVWDLAWKRRTQHG